MEKYKFMYMDSTGRWNETTNPRFIAEYKCVAYHEDELNGKIFADLIWEMNNDNNEQIVKGDNNE